jgi:hypothetical protein
MSSSKLGVLYAATEEDYIEEAHASGKSVREQMPDLDLAIATAPTIGSDPIDSDLFDYVIKLDSPQYGYVDKISGMLATPFERTLYLDTDTHICGSFPELFDLLDQFDIAVASTVFGHQPPNEIHETNIPNATDAFPQPQAFPIYNTGVVAYESTHMLLSFLRRWKERFTGNGPLSNRYIGDQEAFAAELYESNLRIASLTDEYNCRGAGRLAGEVKIIHATHEENRQKCSKFNAETGEVRTFIERWNSMLEVSTRMTNYSPYRSAYLYATETITNGTQYALRCIRKQYQRLL